MTQAAVSHQIKLLEDFLVSSFLYVKSFLELTEFGKAYFVDINKVLRKLNEATERLLTLKKQSHIWQLVCHKPLVFNGLCLI